MNIYELNRVTTTSLKHLGGILDNSQGNFWCKNKDGEYYGVGKQFIKCAGLNSSDLINGTRDSELPWAESAQLILENDNTAMHSRRIQITEEPVLNADKKRVIFLVAKQAVFDLNNNLIGSIGCSTPLIETTNGLTLGQEDSIFNYAAHLSELSQELVSLSKMIKSSTSKYLNKNKIALIINGKTILFTNREIQCLSNLFVGKSAKDTANIYNISSKTVEYYIKKIKIKLKCFNRSQIIELILKNNLMHKLLSYI